MSLENIHERAWMKLSATPTGLIPEESLPFPGFGNPGLEYTIPLGLTSTSGRWKPSLANSTLLIDMHGAIRTPLWTLATPSEGPVYYASLQPAEAGS